MIVLRSLLYVLIFYITLVFCLPKNEIISYVDTVFFNQSEVKYELKLENKIFGYESKNAKINYQNNPAAKIETIDINPYIIYNTFEMKNILLQGMPGSFFPNKIQDVTVIYSIFNPTKISLNITGDFGTALGHLDLVNSIVYLEVTPSALMQTTYSFILNRMKKSGKIYIYEYKL